MNGHNRKACPMTPILSATGTVIKVTMKKPWVILRWSFKMAHPAVAVIVLLGACSSNAGPHHCNQ